MISFPRYFKPCCVLTVAGQTIGDPTLDQLGITPMRVAFKVQRGMTSAPDSAEVSIFGLDPVRREAMHALFDTLGRTPLTIASGYDGVVGHLFRGDVRRMETQTQIGGDTVFSCIADDAGDAMAEAKFSGTTRITTAGMTIQNMIDLALAAFAREGEPVLAHPSVAAVVGSRADVAAGPYKVVFVGSAHDLLDEAARTLGARWWIRDGLLFMARRGLPAEGPETAVVVPRDHWLSQPAADANGIVRLTTFLDPNILPGRQVAIRGWAAHWSTEFFRCDSAEYRADTDASSPWSVAMTLRRIAA